MKLAILAPDRVEAEVPDDFKMAAGAGKQQLYVIPSRGLTIVRLGEEAGYTNAEFLALFLGPLGENRSK